MVKTLVTEVTVSKSCDGSDSSKNFTKKCPLFDRNCAVIKIIQTVLSEQTKQDNNYSGQFSHMYSFFKSKCNTL